MVKPMVAEMVFQVCAAEMIRQQSLLMATIEILVDPGVNLVQRFRLGERWLHRYS